MNGENGEMATANFDVGNMTEWVNRDYTYRQIVETLQMYGLKEDKLSLVDHVWGNKNQLFTSLGKETEDKMFHDESHTNRTVTLVCWSLRAADKDMLITPAEAEDLIIATIIHDLGYLTRTENGAIVPDFSKTAGGHEERSKKYVERLLTEKVDDTRIAHIADYIEKTKIKKPGDEKSASPTKLSDDKGLILRYADLLAGGITVASDDIYKDLVGKLAYEFCGGQDRPEVNRTEEVARGIIAADTNEFFPRVARETEQFVELIGSLGQEYDLRKPMALRLKETQV